ncbi:hypothetical protein ABG067_003265 [Albugo candida]|uniref:CAF1B/HIR1 beta-propeller domain-containing protein n=1 Tax=Albugo candida TaxID=65357 RepID=A0A024G763_9STRA|nr:unnamed protein product [Albugo candida]|eukprot:CCI42593.1 unnamed protein product [Albugo candida]
MHNSVSKLCVETPEIRWHYGPTGLNEAILSLDFISVDKDDPICDSKVHILATGGADKEVKLWRIQPLELPAFIFSLTGHDRSVNCVRFSPNKRYLASASDDATILIWTRAKNTESRWEWHTIQSFSDVSRTLLACGHKGDITDLAWSPDSRYLCSTSIDNTTVIWDIETSSVLERKKDHKEFVQGSAWDPLNEYLVTEGNDRTCRVYALSGLNKANRNHKRFRKCVCVHTIKTRASQANEIDTGKGIDQNHRHRIFVDDTCPAFARRLTWTPDGMYLLTPTALFRDENGQVHNTVYAFARGDLSQPVLHLPGHEKASICVRCVPQLFAQKESNGSNFFQTEFRTVFAVVSLDSIRIYDSQQSHPIYTIRDAHYADLTDASWSADGQVLAVSSTDGYISFLHFEKEHFGSMLAEADKSRILETVRNRMLAGMSAPANKRARSPELLTSKKAEKKRAKLTSTVLKTLPKNEKTLAEKTNVLQVRKKSKTVKLDRIAI